MNKIESHKVWNRANMLMLKIEKVVSDANIKSAFNGCPHGDGCYHKGLYDGYQHARGKIGC